jgi:hypothetical protein
LHFWWLRSDPRDGPVTAWMLPFGHSNDNSLFLQTAPASIYANLLTFGHSPWQYGGSR